MTSNNNIETTIATPSGASSNSTSLSCWERLVHVEWILCGMGDLWGRIESSSSRLLVAWWFTRHLLYGGLATIVLVWAPSAIFIIAVIFLAAHLYKLGRFGIISSWKERERLRQKRSMAMRAKDTETTRHSHHTNQESSSHPIDSNQKAATKVQVHEEGSHDVEHGAAMMQRQRD